MDRPRESDPPAPENQTPQSVLQQPNLESARKCLEVESCAEEKTRGTEPKDKGAVRERRGSDLSSSRRRGREKDRLSLRESRPREESLRFVAVGFSCGNALIRVRIHGRLRSARFERIISPEGSKVEFPLLPARSEEASRFWITRKTGAHAWVKLICCSHGDRGCLVAFRDGHLQFRRCSAALPRELPAGAPWDEEHRSRSLLPQPRQGGGAGQGAANPAG